MRPAARRILRGAPLTFAHEHRRALEDRTTAVRLGRQHSGDSRKRRGTHVNPRSYGIGIYAPAGFAPEPAAIERAVVYLKSRGHRVIVDPTATSRWQRFAAADDERLAAVQRMAADPGVELAVAVRGGYGWSRLLDRLDFAAIASARKRWLGHSDFTAFQLAALAHANMTTFAGPMVSYDFGAEIASEYTISHCFDALSANRHTIEWHADGADVDCTGTLWGGNLALVAHLCGTPHFPCVDGGILFLEDVGEYAYRIERMLYQLHLAGVLARQSAILLGTFNGFDAQPNDNGYGLADVIAQARLSFGAPVVEGLPFGHIRDKVTLPVGARASLSMRDGTAKLVLEDYDV